MKLELTQKLQQQQILTPQMILSMKILLLTNQELELRIENEITENPALEVKEPSAEEEGTPSALEGEPLSPLPADEKDEHLFRHLDGFQNLPPLYYFEGPPSRRSHGEDSFDKHEALQNLAGEPPGLREDLIQQLHFLDLPARLVEIGEYIINNFDERGYLVDTPQAIHQALNQACERPVPGEEFTAALEAVRSLDPPGVGAENLQGCLILQLKRDPQSYPLEIEILQNHVEDLRQNKIPKIAKDLGKTMDEVKDALEIIAMLDPYPGRQFSSPRIDYLRPDAMVENVNGKLQVKIEDRYLPNLQISESCRQLLESCHGQPEVTGFLRKKIESAQMLIQAIRQRQRTLEDIVEAIINYQKEFMEHGPSHLKAMKMQTIADQVGVHISTISRAIKGKSIQTPYGIFELRYFFTGGVENAEGEVESRRKVYQKIAELIQNEDKSHPLSDTEVANKLREQGLDIARRTVTKYRDQEGILPSRLRKVY
ncbi:MAG: RNA polymerase factor sigma-54 [Planctomycetes bacterium]|nr:RNA polymerase factor sigma-54 [Planctomycetota bacterium]